MKKFEGLYRRAMGLSTRKGKVIDDVRKTRRVDRYFCIMKGMRSTGDKASTREHRPPQQSGCYGLAKDTRTKTY